METPRNPLDWTPLPEPYTFVDAPLWWHTRGLSETASGYGRALTHPCKVKLPDGQLRRVYVTIYSNAGTAWIKLNGARRIVRDSR